MRFIARHLILAPFALVIIAVHPLVVALDWASAPPRVVESLRDELRTLYRGFA